MFRNVGEYIALLMLLLSLRGVVVVISVEEFPEYKIHNTE